MTARTRRQKYSIVDRSLQYRVLAIIISYSLVIVLFLAICLFVPDILSMSNEQLGWEVRAAAVLPSDEPQSDMQRIIQLCRGTPPVPSWFYSSHPSKSRLIQKLRKMPVLLAPQQLLRTGPFPPPLREHPCPHALFLRS